MTLEPKIIFEDPHLMVLSKPAGLLSQSDHTKEFSLIDWCRHYLKRHYVGLIHRLDRNTSGLLLIAKRSKSASRLTQSLQTKKINRTYLGWLIGKFTQSVRWQDSLTKDKTINFVHQADTNQPHQIAILHAKPLQYASWNHIPITLTQFVLETGRSHQIRVQSALHHFPLLGDQKYGTQHSLFPASQTFPRIALHAYQLSFPHPMTQIPLTFQDPLPQELDLSS